MFRVLKDPTMPSHVYVSFKKPREITFYKGKVAIFRVFK